MCVGGGGGGGGFSLKKEIKNSFPAMKEGNSASARSIARVGFYIQIGSWILKIIKA